MGKKYNCSTHRGNGDQRMEKIKCPLCNSTRTEILYTLPLEEVTKRVNPRSTEIDEEIKAIWGRDYCEFVKCDNCLLNFAHPFIGGSNKLYSLIYDEEDKYPKAREEYFYSLPHVKEGDICLEIGSGSGVFLDLLKKKISSKNVHSVEISDNNSEYKTLFEIPSNKKFSKFFMFSVIEHLDNLQKFADKINQISTKDAEFFIAMPHKEAINFYMNTLGFGSLPPIHITEWEEKTIKQFFGWEVVEHRTSSLSRFAVLKDLFYGIRTLKYPASRNPIKMIFCLLEAFSKWKFKRLKGHDYYHLKKGKDINKTTTKPFTAIAGESRFNCRIEGTEEELEEFFGKEGTKNETKGVK